jgi:hypothetical protein
MNNKVLIVLVVIIILAGGGWYFLSSKKQTPGTTSSVENMTQSQESQLADDSGTSLKELFTSGVSQTCTFDVSDESYTSQGTVYVANNKMRGNFETTVDGTIQSSHMIVDGDTSYMWVDGEPRGFKMVFDGEAGTNSEAQVNQNSVDIDAKYDYNCKAGVVNASNFSLPKNVEFVSLTDMVQGAQDETSSQCDVCEGLSAESKTQCLTLLKCN